MSAAVTTGTGSETWAARLFAVALAVAMAGALVLPRAAPALLGVLFLAGLPIAASLARPAVGSGPSVGLRALWPANTLTLTLLAFTAYCALSATWSAGPLAALGKVAWLAVVIVAVNLLLGLIDRLDGPALQKLVIGLVAAVAFGAIFALIEVARGQPIMRFLYNTIGLFRPEANKHMVFENGRITRILPYVMNRNVGALNLLLWPALMGIAALAGTSPRARLASLALVAVAGIATAISEHESSMIALILAIVVFALARLKLSAARGLVAAGWIAAVLAMLPAVTAAFSAELYKAGAIPLSGRARIVLWHFTATEYVKHPVFGVGANSTRAIDENLKPTAVQLPDQPYAQRTGQHAHNIFVQTWFELGIVGALLLLAAGWQLFRAIGRLPELAQPHALAAFSSAMAIACFTWGLWQEWYQTLFGLSVLGGGLAARLCEGRGMDDLHMREGT